MMSQALSLELQRHPPLQGFCLQNVFWSIVQQETRGCAAETNFSFHSVNNFLNWLETLLIQFYSLLFIHCF